MTSSFSSKVILGRTGLAVSRLGIGSAYGVSERACCKAFEAGVNYFFWGSIRTPGMARAIRSIGRTERARLVVVLQCYARSPRFIQWSVERGLKTLGIEQADILLLGWYNEPPSEKTLACVHRMKEQGRFRFLGISSHNRPLFRRLLVDDIYDVFHIRYNAAHRGAEKDIVPFLPDRNGPGIVSFTNTRWGTLLDPKHMPEGARTPTAADCYRFVLSNPWVHVALCGPKNDAEMDMALSVLHASPMDEDEMEWMRAVGDYVHTRHTLMSLLS